MRFDIGAYERHPSIPTPIPPPVPIPIPVPLPDVYLKTRKPVIIHKRRKSSGNVELTVDKDMTVVIE